MRYIQRYMITRSELVALLAKRRGGFKVPENAKITVDDPHHDAGSNDVTDANPIVIEWESKYPLVEE